MFISKVIQKKLALKYTYKCNPIPGRVHVLNCCVICGTFQLHSQVPPPYDLVIIFLIFFSRGRLVNDILSSVFFFTIVN